MSVSSGSGVNSGSSSKNVDNQMTTNKPKGPTNAFTYYMKSAAAEIRKNPNVKIPAECSRLWKTMTEEQKKPYVDLANADKKRHSEEIKHYIPSAEEIMKTEQKNDPLAPMTPLTSYNWFCDDIRYVIKDEHPDYTFAEMTREMGSRWQLLDEQQKAKYVKLANSDKYRYDTEMGLYHNLIKGHPKAVPKVKEAQSSSDSSSSDDSSEDEDNIQTQTTSNGGHNIFSEMMMLKRMSESKK